MSPSLGHGLGCACVECRPELYDEAEQKLKETRVAPSEEPAPMKRANYIGVPQFFNLNQACRVITEAFGFCVYLVGSSLRTKDYRDVDVRCILADEEFDRLFPNCVGDPKLPMHLDARWSIICSSISLYLSQHSGLPIDFQIQRQTQANAEHKGPRNALGLFVRRETPRSDEPR